MTGGELFDHILAHRYLKDRDAQRLFAQLISAVHYLHEKKIVHRDLKLENLLLDSKRNIIVTDFGFANRFEDKGSDLMATSCGSPCYAAPELVVQDGRYVGNAVDVWSCGVILYAMLAGYLPFDDDPTNPDSENINLLYKYIINTPLTFPDWVSPGARDLLHLMLVPDPAKRCGLEDVMSHPWLADHAGLFVKSIEQVEGMAAEEDEERRAASERQRDAVLQQEAVANGTSSNMSRSQSSSITGNRHQSAFVVPTSSTTQNLAATAGRPQGVPSQSTSAADKAAKRASASSAAPPHGKSAQAFPSTSNAQATADGFSFDKSSPASAEPQSSPMAPSSSAPSRPQTGQEIAPSTPQPKKQAEDESASASTRKRRTAANRYTVQVEYDANANGGAARDSSSTKSRRNSSQIPVHVTNPASPTSKAHGPGSSIESPTRDGTPTKIPVRSTRSSQADPEAAAAAAAVAAPSPLANEAPAPAPATPTSRKREANEEAEALAARAGAAEKKADDPRSSAAPPTPAAHEQGQAPFPERRSDSVASPSKASTRSRASRHQKASSVVSIARFLPGNAPAPGGAAPARESAEMEVLDEKPDDKRRSRRKALSLVVDPFRTSTSSTRSGSVKRSSVRAPPTAGAERQESRQRTPSNVSHSMRPQRPASNAPTPQATTSQASQRPARPAAPAASATPAHDQASFAGSQTAAAAAAPQGGKAKKVMDWFRWKSMPRDASMGADLDKAAVAPPITDFDKGAKSNDTHAAAGAPPEDDVSPAPQVVVTDDTPPLASQAESESARVAADTSGDVSINGGAGGLRHDPSDASVHTSGSGERKPAEPFDDAKLRFHQGAVDQAALTSRSPPGVLVDLRKTLFAMGIDAKEEAGPFRLRCVRQSSKKTAAAYGVPVNQLHLSTNSAQAPALSFTQQASGRVTSSLTPSPSSTFRSLFSRRGSHNSQAGAPSPALSQSSSSDPHVHEQLMSSLAPSTSSLGPGPGMPVPFFGNEDPGAEVRFTVEVSRIKGLPNLYTIDIRRLKGNLWSYRSVRFQAFFSSCNGVC